LTKYSVSNSYFGVRSTGFPMGINGSRRCTKFKWSTSKTIELTSLEMQIYQKQRLTCNLQFSMKLQLYICILARSIT